MLAGGLGSRVAMRIAALAAPDGVRGLTDRGRCDGRPRSRSRGRSSCVLFAGVGIGARRDRVLPDRPVVAAAPAAGSERSPSAGSSSWCSARPGARRGERRLHDPRSPRCSNVAVFSFLFILHGVLLVVLVEPSGRLVAAARGATPAGAGSLVDVATFAAMAVTAVRRGRARGSVERMGDPRDDRAGRLRGRPRPDRSSTSSPDHASDAAGRGRDRTR